jgi:uncharacterized phage-like protein YoqJ
METLKVVYVSGYRSSELGIFKEKDPKIKVIKNVLKNELRLLAESGLEWVLVSGNLGTELWAAEAAAELKVDYPDLRLGIIYPFLEFGSNWNEANQTKKMLAEQTADYVESVSHQPYRSPAQLKSHTQFLLSHTDGCLLIYDKEFPGKTSYFLQDAEKYAEQHSYDIRLITMDDLQNSIQ